jgi:hypothetical protein
MESGEADGAQVFMNSCVMSLARLLLFYCFEPNTRLNMCQLQHSDRVIQMALLLATSC